MFTVITRTSNRPRFFAECRRSVLEQTIRPFHLVGTDDPNDTYPEGDLVVQLPPRRGRESNLHFNDLIRHVPDTHPFVILLDDDDIFTSPNSLCRIYEVMEEAYKNTYWLSKKELYDFLLVQWRMQRLDHTIPRDCRVGKSDVKEPEYGDCTGGGICFNKNLWVNWDDKSGADYRFIITTYYNSAFLMIDDILTAMQSVPGEGRREDKK